MFDKPYTVAYYAVYFGERKEKQTRFDSLDTAVLFAEKVYDSGYSPVYVKDSETHELLYEI